MIETDLFRADDAESIDYVKSKIPLGRLGRVRRSLP